MACIEAYVRYVYIRFGQARATDSLSDSELDWPERYSPFQTRHGTQNGSKLGKKLNRCNLRVAWWVILYQLEG
jgi:hypothetical protein